MKSKVVEVVESAIKDLQMAQARGIDRRHKEVLIWKACFDLEQLMEMLNEAENRIDRDRPEELPRD